jgi:hypothetical protein
MSLLNKILLEGLKEIVILTIMVCADEYKFDGNEALSKICMNDVMTKMSSYDALCPMDSKESSMLSAKLSSTLGEKVREEVREEERKEKKETKKLVKKTEKKEEKSEIPMPYNGEHNEECCNGLKYNFGLYTQCKVKSKNGEKYCKMCENQASKHGHGKPTYGTIQDRLEVGIMDFVDPSGKKPEMYMKVLKKQIITIDEAVDEAKKQKITINSIHFEEESEVVSEKVVEKSKGRPKKGKKLLEIGNEEGDEDLLNTLLVAAKEKEAPEAEKKKKEAERKKKEEEKEAKEAEKKKKEAERKQKEEEKEAKEAEKKKEKEAEQKKKEQEKEKKEQEKKKKEQEAEKKKKEPEEEASGEVAKVKRFTYTDGLVYLKSETGIVYNSDHDEVGKWNNLTKSIEFNVEKDDRELSEDEYEEEEEEEELEDLKNDEEEEDDE